MALRKLSDAELRAAERRMRTASYKRAVERLRKRHNEGNPSTFPEMAKELKIPLELVLAVFCKHVEEETGAVIRPVGLVQ